MTVFLKLALMTPTTGMLRIANALATSRPAHPITTGTQVTACVTALEFLLSMIQLLVRLEMNALVELYGTKNAASANHAKTKDYAQRMNSSTLKFANACAYLNAVKMDCLGTMIFAVASTTFALSKRLFATGFKPNQIGSSLQDLTKTSNQHANM